MAKIRVTAQQRANALECLNVMWPSVPPENVYPRLGFWRKGDATRPATCGTVACFGGWCALWPPFKAQGIAASSLGMPIVYGGAPAALFGADDSIFFVRRPQEHGTDHEVVTKRLRALIKNSVVV